jgi:hypothetical protein
MNCKWVDLSFTDCILSIVCDDGRRFRETVLGYKTEGKGTVTIYGASGSTHVLTIRQIRSPLFNNLEQFDAWIKPKIESCSISSGSFSGGETFAYVCCKRITTVDDVITNVQYIQLKVTYDTLGDPEYRKLSDNSSFTPTGADELFAGQCPINPIAIAGGITYVDDNAEKNPQPNFVNSLTVTKQFGDNVQISFDYGATWPLEIISEGSRTLEKGDGHKLIDVSAFRFKLNGTMGVYDVIWD